MSREFGDADSSGCLPKSEFSRDFQSADHTALFGPPEPETQFETPNPFLSAVPSNIQFLFIPEGVGEVVKLHLPFLTLDNGTLVDQQLTFLVGHPDYGKVLEFSPPPAYSGMAPKGTANVTLCYVLNRHQAFFICSLSYTSIHFLNLSNRTFFNKCLS
ncbi:hypothetical protein AVEN_21821-1 [Araneus ventricosus]|uniref:Uncharacterized protein n=1 Tax=Araneus ventricosus TaxID=182803 RepID=A0A4Y2NZN3_ARAVE|nr:hypothetical protein AVEN_21821-1 [Araneus ventricosus]